MSKLAVGRTQFVDSKFGSFGGFGRVHSLILVVEPGFRRDRILVFMDLGLGLACFRLNKFKVRVFWRSSKGFKVPFWWTNLGLSEFEV